MNKMQSITPFQSSQGPTNEKQTGDPVKVKSMASKQHMGGTKDALYKAFTGPKKQTTQNPVNPSKQSRPTGSRYTPAGQFGRIKK